VDLPEAAPLHDLDASWPALLAHDWRGGLQAGTDTVFSHGPLGFLLLQPTPGFQADLFAGKAAATLVASLVFTIVSAALVRRLPAAGERMLGAFAVLGLATFVPECMGLPLLLAATVLALDRPAGPPWRESAASALLAVFSLAKFTCFLLAVPCVAALVAVTWQRGSWRGAAAVAGSSAATLVLCWLLAGQDLGGLPVWLRTSFEFADGYQATMGTRGSSGQLALGLTCALLTGAGCAAVTLARPRGLVPAALGFVVLTGTFVAWKAGFVRHDRGHVRLFFAVTTFAPLLPALMAKERGHRWYRGGGLAVMVLSVGTLSRVSEWSHGLLDAPAALLRRVTSHAGQLASLDRYAEEQECQQSALSAADAMPETARALGPGSIDAFGYEQGVLFANGFRVRHRPVFQSYAAFTPLLQEINAACYEAPSGPDCVLFKLQPTDGYFPTVQDSQALVALLTGYLPVLEEREYLLLRRRSEPRTRADVPRETVLERRVAMGDQVQLAGLPGALHLLSLDVAWSPAGRLQGFLLRPPRLWLEVQLDDGQVLRFRIAPPLVRAPFLLDPLLQRTADLRSLQGNVPLHRVLAFRVVSEHPPSSGFEDLVGVHVIACDGLLPGR
jgi:hypothetical protein